jgi:DNA-binding MarR family transcriptional regulator
MTSTLSRMRQNGLIEISADPADGRAKLVSLTQKGREMRQKCLAAIEPLLPLAATALSEEEIATMLPKLANLRALLDKARD